MGIKLYKKESMEHCDSCGAVMTEYDYDRYGGLCKYCRDKGEAKKPAESSKKNEKTANIGDTMYASKLKSLVRKFATFGVKVSDKVEVLEENENDKSADYKLSASKDSNTYSINVSIYEGKHTTISVKDGSGKSVVSGEGKSFASALSTIEQSDFDGTNESRKKSEVSVDEGADGFAHVWELQAQQAKETLEELTKKFGDADRLGFEIRNYPHAQECDAVVTVDGDPFITAEFEGGTHSGIRWHCFEDDTTDVRLDVGEEDAARNMILAFKDDILDALESLYGFGAIADEGGQRTEKTAWSYLVELETLEGAESRQEATEKILKALGYNPGTEGRWYNKDGEEIGIIDTLDNTEWDFAVKTCGQLQESTEKQETSTNPRWCVEFGDIYSNVEKEYYDTEEDAKARYDELAERGDIEWVENPVMEAAEEETASYDDYAESVKSILMGREFEYGPETANQFVVDDYNDIVRKNFDAGKGPFTAAADIDDAYMGKE